jgi:hypothetical protein
MKTLKVAIIATLLVSSANVCVAEDRANQSDRDRSTRSEAARSAVLPSRDQSAVGTVKQPKSDQFTLQTSGSETVVRITDNTRFERNGTQVSSNALAEGERVSVLGDRSGRMLTASRVEILSDRGRAQLHDERKGKQLYDQGNSPDSPVGLEESGRKNSTYDISRDGIKRNDLRDDRSMQKD